MKTISYLLSAMLCLMATSCSLSNRPAALTAGIDTANLDTTACPGADFYQFASGGWIKSHPLPPEYSRFGTFDELAETTTDQIRGLIQELSTTTHEPGSVAQKVGDLYAIAMDSTKLNAEGIAPIRADLDAIADLSRTNIYALLGDLSTRGIGAYLGLYIGADEKNSTQNAVQISQGGLSMRERDYYLLDDSATVAIRNAFTAHVKTMFTLCGYDEATADRAVQVVMGVETRLAKAYRSRVELRDPYANYNKMSLDEVKATYPTFDWDAYLEAKGIGGRVTEIIVGQPASLAAAAKEIDTLPTADQVLYLQWKLISAAAPYLSDDLVAANFDFFSRTLTGAKEMQPRWKRAVGVVQRALGQAVGQMYVERYFPAAAKERMKALVANLQATLGDRISNLAWMSDSTKTRALEKLATFHVKIGYPDKWKDYSALEITNDSYWANAVRASQWASAEMADKLGKEVDREEWFMTPQTVNAYYNPTTNEICFPAGILQPPFFDMQADDAFNYGAIGVVIGHEMTHGFDDQGRQYDKDGNLRDWWTEEDAARFTERAQVMIDFFDKIEVAPGVHANGQQTIGENIADYGGLQVAFQAFRAATADAPLADKDGFTPEQRFFIAYSGLWSANITEEAIRYRTKTDVHALGKWRVNGTLPQIGAWYDAFGITEDAPMYVPEAERVSIW